MSTSLTGLGTKEKLDDLENVPDDGRMMNEMLRSGYEIKTVSNVGDILKEVNDFNTKHKSDNALIGRMHFHFSGHGVHNAKMFIAEEMIFKAIEANTETVKTNTPLGECMIGSTGELYSTHDLKHELINHHNYPGLL